MSPGLSSTEIQKRIDIDIATRTLRRDLKILNEQGRVRLEGKGTSVVEIVSTCNSGWKLNPVDSNNWMVENMFPAYPLGDLKNL